MYVKLCPRLWVNIKLRVEDRLKKVHVVQLHSEPWVSILTGEGYSDVPQGGWYQTAAYGERWCLCVHVHAGGQRAPKQKAGKIL